AEVEDTAAHDRERGHLLAGPPAAFAVSPAHDADHPARRASGYRGRAGRGDRDGLRQVGEHLDQFRTAAGRVDLSGPVGELVEGDTALAAVPAQAVDHLRPFLVGQPDTVGRAALWLEAHPHSLP